MLTFISDTAIPEIRRPRFRSVTRFVCSRSRGRCGDADSEGDDGEECAELHFVEVGGMEWNGIKITVLDDGEGGGN